MAMKMDVNQRSPTGSGEVGLTLNRWSPLTKARLFGECNKVAQPRSSSQTPTHARLRQASALLFQEAP